MLKDVAGFALLAVATLSVMRAGAKMGSGPSTTQFAVAVATVACVPAASHVSVRAAIGLLALLALLGGDAMAVLLACAGLGVSAGRITKP